ncbi:MAG TPA: D-2-hydroxyacid dehydrogenase [Candidatus Mediterraneibacter intestinavium]|nr:D-2-hydroxyacid dehydrogenase [Candidatus Mediterraneibacter intestinavium]
MKIVFLDAKTLGDDIDYTGFEQMGEVVRYPFTSTEEAPDRVKDADVLVVNKVLVNRRTISSAENLKLVCVTATGTNNLDKDYLAERGIAWRNVAGYSTESVAQHTFAILFYLMENLRYYDDYVKEGRYINDRIFTHFAKTFHELNGMTWGILGLGAIGRRVADIAGMFGAKVIYYSASGAPAQEGYHQVDFDTLLSESDILSIHAPLNEYTVGLMDAEAFRKMKSSAILLNLGRGPIINESDLAAALNAGEISAAGLDVLCAEPMSKENPLLDVHDKDRLFITPHIAWATVEARQRLMKIIEGQIREFFGSK